MNDMAWAEEMFGNVKLGDLRRTRRLVQIACGIAERPNTSVNASFPLSAERQGAYRLLSHPELSTEELTTALWEDTLRRSAPFSFVFVAEDGTSLSFRDPQRRRGTGPVGSRCTQGRGFQLQTSLAISPDGLPLGIPGLAWWKRPEEAPQKPTQKRLPEEKETHYWIEMIRQISRRFEEAKGPRPWFVCDRAADAWSVLHTADTLQAWVTVRSSHNRRLVTPPREPRRYLWETLAQAPRLGQFGVFVPGKKKREDRWARLEVRATKVCLHMTDDNYHSRVEMSLWAVEAVEVDPPEGEEALHWRLLTTHPVESAEEAYLTLFGYAQRWRVEEFHRAWKSGVTAAEANQLQSEGGIQKWAILQAAVAVRVLRMTYEVRERPEAPATEGFTEVEIEAVALASGKPWKEGSPPTLQQMVLRIASLGGYSKNPKKSPPGFLTLTRGWKYVQPIVEALTRLRVLHGNGPPGEKCDEP